MTTYEPKRYCPGCGSALSRQNRRGRCAVCTPKKAQPVKAPSVPDLPADFWEHPSIGRALATRDPGYVIGAYRFHPHWRRRGFGGRPTVAQWVVAGWLGISQAKLSRLESAKEDWDPFLVVRAMQVLKVPRGVLWFALPDQPIPPDLRRMDSLTRRSLLAKAGGAAVVLGAGMLAPRAPASTVKLDPDFVPLKLELLGVLVAQTYLGGPEGTERILRAELASIRERREQTNRDPQRELMRLEAFWTDHAGWLRRELGDFPNALRLLAKAAKLAEEAEDTLMVGYVRAHQSGLARELGDARRATELAQAVQREPGLTSHVRALGALREAEALSLLGPSASAACQRKIDEAYEHVQREQNGTWVPRLDAIGSEFTTRKWVQAGEAGCHMRLRAPHKAVGLYEDAIASATRPMGRGLQSARLAVALAYAGEVDRAAAEGIRVLELAKTTRAASITHELRTLDRQLGKSDASSASTFGEALAQYV